MMRTLILAIAVILISCKPQVVIETPALPITRGKVVRINAPFDLKKDQPKLVIGITIDQMRMDFLYRYWDDFEKGGFKRLVAEGFLCANHHYDYSPTYTGPGHASIYTGTTPALHGIISNDWYDKRHGEMVYCVKDTLYKGVGTDSKGGKMSPHRLLASTISDELMLSNNFASKVIGISMKDRGAILPAGHKPTAAYWYMGGDEGNWATSSYYMENLPQWVQGFNAKGLSEKYVSQGWNLLKDASAYNESTVDNNPYEGPFKGQFRAAFPYDFSDITENRYDLIKATPHGSTLSVDFAIEAIKAEQMGADATTDLLALSFSSTDYVGHQFGPAAIETQDCYLRLDADIERLLNFLDDEIGEGEYMIFLTADHGAAQNPGYMKKLGIEGGYWKPQVMLDEVDAMLKENYGIGEWVLNYTNDQFFLNTALMEDRKVDLNSACEKIAAVCMKHEEVYTALPTSVFRTQDFEELPLNTIQRGIHPQRSGHVVLVTSVGWIPNGYTGTTHGSPYSYDTHVPLIFFGAGIEHGQTARRTVVRDIAPTVSMLMKITQPNATTGDPVFELFKTTY
ncbi:MAG: putative AlkP superfamily pyrophosphatase or phosphodiesterase [Flavobacteriales bacterium]|jgi:predicted AlkP superfamily pyrophosphatase or phosphodiesterase